MIFRYDDLDNHWFARVDGYNTDNIRIYERNAASNTVPYFTLRVWGFRLNENE